MSEANLRQLRVLHMVSSGAVANGLQQSLFMPLLTRMPKHRVKAQIVSLSPNVVNGAVLRQSGVPVHEVSLSRHRFSFAGFKELLEAARAFRPDVIQAWGHTAQIFSILVRQRCDWKPRVVWSVAGTAPLAKNAGLIDRQKLKYAARLSAKADRIVYASEAGASQHRRAGFPDGGHLTAPPGADAVRFKPDFAARRKLREQLHLPPEAFVIGMVAPFQPEYDHGTFFKAVGEVIKSNPNVAIVLAGHGVQKGNAPLMAMVGGGTMGTRTHLLGEWSDLTSFFNACEIVCSSAQTDSSRMTLVTAMLCGVPCVATGMGAQGEVIGQHGVAIEAGSPAALTKGINRLMLLPAEKRAFMAQGARKHALQNYVYVRSLQKYLQLYYDLVGRQSLGAEDVPVPEVDATVTVPPPLPALAPKKAITVTQLTDPDSLEAKVAEQSSELPKWRQQQEEERSRKEADVAQKVAASAPAGDVLQVFEERIKPGASDAAADERARGVTEEVEDFLSPELLATPVPASTRPPATAPKAPVIPAAVVQPKKSEPKADSPAVVAAVAKAEPPAAPVVKVEPAPVAAAAKVELTPESPTVDDLKVMETLSLFPAAPPPVSSEDPTVKEPSLQLELLPDPPPADLKRAVNDLG